VSEEITRALLEVMLARIEREPATNNWKLVGIVSDSERNALVDAIKRFGGQIPPGIQVPVSRFAQVPKSRASDLNLESLRRTAPDNPEILLCLDFGTAMSKAMATQDRDENLVEIPLGVRGGDPGEVYGLRSSLFITRAGRIHFGHDAITKSSEVEEGVARKRLDSLKQRLSQGRPGDLTQGMLDEATNPTTVALSWADVIALYLGYLTDIATSELEDGRHLSRYVKRRFAQPCWEHGRATWAAGELRSMLAKAQIVADTFHGRWREGIPADEVKATIDAVSALDRLPEYLLADGIDEPVAAAASRIEKEDRDRGLFVVVDVGAGTTDFAAFWSDQDPERDLHKIWQIPGTVDALTQAGDTIDGYLHDFLLEKAHLRYGHTDFNYASSRLALEIRQYKESLMKSGELEVVLTNSSRVKVSREEFLSTEAVNDFKKLLRDRLVGVLRRADRSWFDQLATFERLGRDKITLVFTGGGSALPVFKDLTGISLEVHGRRFSTLEAPAVPNWITEGYSVLSGAYPQMAVAIGGAARRLPELGPETPRFGGLGGPANWSLPVEYKK
jgi:hypothetical protein